MGVELTELNEEELKVYELAIIRGYITADMVSNSNSCNTSIGVELDYSNSICEYDGTNNTYCADNKAIDIPNIEVNA